MSQEATVCLQAVLPSSETVCIDAGYKEEMRTVKSKIASLSGFCTESFTLIFDGEKVGGEDDGRVVGELPLEDQSMLLVTPDAKHEARRRLVEQLGHEPDLQSFKLFAFNTHNFLSLMIKAGRCEDTEDVGELMAHYVKDPETADSLANIEMLLAHTGVDVNYRIQPFGETLLHSATEWTRQETMKVLLHHGADVNSMDYMNKTPLHYAAQPNCALILIQHNATIDVKDKQGMTPLHHILTTSFDEPKAKTALLLIRHGADVYTMACPVHRSLLHTAVSDLSNWHRTDSPRHWVSFLLDNGCDAGTVDNNGFTPLHLALRLGKNSMVSRFIEYIHKDTIWLNHQDNKGRTLLHLAVGSRETLCFIQSLLEVGVDKNIADSDGLTPFRYLFRKNVFCSNTACCLLGDDRLREVCVLDDAGQTLLHKACGGEATRFLLNHGADVQARDNSGSTPLHLASAASRLSTVEALLHGGADVCAKDNDGQTPYNLAQTETVRRLLKKN